MDRRTFNSLLGGGLVAAAAPLSLRGALAAEPVKVGYVYLGPVGDFGWTYQHDVARKDIRIPQSGSLFWRVDEMFDGDALRAAGAHAYVIVRDEICRLFGYHGVEGGAGSFSLDHMFGF